MQFFFGWGGAGPFGEFLFLGREEKRGGVGIRRKTKAFSWILLWALNNNLELCFH